VPELDLTISKQDLSRMFTRAAVATDSKSPLITANNIFLNADNGRLTVRATDSYLGVESSAVADIKTAGSIALDARRSSEAAKSLPGTEVRLRLVKNQLEVSSGKTRFKLGSFSADDLPELPRAAEATEVGSIDALVFARVLARGSYAADTDESRFDACGAFVEAMSGLLSVRSFDRNRVAEASIQVDTRDFCAFVPSKNLIEIRKLCEAAKEMCTLYAHASYLFVRVGDTVMSATTGNVLSSHRLYGKVITTCAKSAKDRVVLHRDGLIGAIKRVSIVNLEKVPDRVPEVYLHFSDGQLRIRAANTTADEAEETLECDSALTRDLRLSPKYLLDALLAVADDEVVIGLGKNNVDGVLITGAASEEHRAVVMPMQIERGK
jgi:DNA polymerase-3 subunit beta